MLFLAALRKHGTRWVAARQAGVSHDTIQRHEQADPDFAQLVRDAKEEYADVLELNLRRLALKRDNVIANIVALKKHRPGDYIERNQTLTVNVNAAVDGEEGRQLLRAMFGSLTRQHAPQALPESGETQELAAGHVIEATGERAAASDEGA